MADRAARSVRSGRGLTTRGRCLLAGGVAAVICAFVLDERDLLRVGLLAVLLPVVALLITTMRRVQLRAEHQVVPDRLHPNAAGEVTLTLINDGSSRTPALDIAESPTEGLSRGLRGLVAPIRRGSGTRVRYRIQAGRRGRFMIGPPRIRVHDVFDLWEEHRVLDSTAEVLVVPAVVPLAGMPASSGARSAASGRSAVGTTGGDPDVGVRPYRPGDDIRTIHWRASARQDDLVVRTDEPVSHGGATVLLDHRQVAHRGVGAGSSLETAVVLAASVTLHLLGADHQVRLTTHRAEVLAQGHDIADEVLAQLAVLEPDEDTQLRRAEVGSAGLLVAVVGELSVTDAALLGASRNRSVNAVALVVETGGWGAGGETGTPVAASILSAAGWRVAVVRRGDDLADAWRQVCVGGGLRAVALSS